MPIKARTPLMLGLALAMAMMADTCGGSPGHTVIPSAVPSTVSPAVNNGAVYGIAQTGTGTATTTVIGGTFSSVTAPGGAATARSHIAAFYPATGALRALNPTLNGDVQDVLEGPTAGTVYVAGNFTTVNGVAQSHLRAARRNHRSPGARLHGNLHGTGPFSQSPGPATGCTARRQLHDSRWRCAPRPGLGQRHHRCPRLLHGHQRHRTPQQHRQWFPGCCRSA